MEGGRALIFGMGVWKLEGYHCIVNSWTLRIEDFERHFLMRIEVAACRPFSRPKVMDGGIISNLTKVLHGFMRIGRLG